jgi:hypothetical protein
MHAHEYQVSGPYTHDNLAVYLIHGPETMPGKTWNKSKSWSTRPATSAS